MKFKKKLSNEFINAYDLYMWGESTCRISRFGYIGAFELL